MTEIMGVRSRLSPGEAASSGALPWRVQAAREPGWWLLKYPPFHGSTRHLRLLQMGHGQFLDLDPPVAGSDDESVPRCYPVLIQEVFRQCNPALFVDFQYILCCHVSWCLLPGATGSAAPTESAVLLHRSPGPSGPRTFSVRTRSVRSISCCPEHIQAGMSGARNEERPGLVQRSCWPFPLLSEHHWQA